MWNIRHFRTPEYRSLIAAFFASCLLLLFIACGGSSKPSVAVAITTHPASITAGTTYTFAATVTNGKTNAVTWTISCPQGITDCGSISQDGTYVTPSGLTQQSSLTVTATSHADASRSDSAWVALLPPIAVAVGPGSAQLVAGFSYPFSASVQNDMDYGGVTWMVNGIPGGDAGVGTITPVADTYSPTHLTGLYTAPAAAPASPVTIMAVSLVDGSKSASASVSFIPNPHPNFIGTCALLVYGPGGFGSDAAGGVLTLDGAGHLTGTLDIHVSDYINDTVVSAIPVTGAYGFNGSDAGYATITYTAGGQSASLPFRFVFISDTVAKVMEFDQTGSDMGTIEKQTDDFALTLNGNYVFALNGAQPAVPGYQSQLFPILGQFNGSAGVLSGVYDVVDTDLMNHQSHPLSGTYALTGNSGSANLGVKDGTSLLASPDFFLYPVSASRALVLSKATPLIFGWIDKQSSDTFSAASLQGEWVFYNAPSPSLNSATLGRFTSDGLGASGPGCTDSPGAGWLPPACYPMFDLGPYTIDSTGRGFAPQTQWGYPSPAYFYFIDANHGRFGSKYGIGEFFRTEGEPFSTMTLNGNYTIVMNNSQIGTAAFDGNGNVSMNVDWNGTLSIGLREGYQRTGTYAFDSGLYATGERGTMVMDDGMQLVYYAVSPDTLLVLPFGDGGGTFGMVQRSTAPPAP